MAKSIARSVAVRRRALRVKLRHVGWGAIEVAGGMLLVAALAVGGFYWRLSQGDISLGFVTKPIEASINEGLSGYSVNIEDTVLERVSEGRGVSFRLKGLVLRAPNGSVIAAAPKAEIGLSMRALLFGRVQARRIELIGAQLALIYDERGRLRIGLNSSSAEHETAVLSEPQQTSQSYSLAAAAPDSRQSSEAEGQSFAAGVALLQNLLAGSHPRNDALGVLEEIGISQTKAVFIHKRLARQWTMQNGTVRVGLQEGALHVAAGADLTYQGKPIPVRAQVSLRNVEGGVNVTGTLSDVVPHDIARSVDAENLFTALDMPVTASFAGEVSDDGTLRGGLMDLVLGAGNVRLLGEDRDGLFLDEAKLRVSYDAAQRLIELHPSEVFSGQSSAVLEGRIFAGPRDGPVPDTWRYDIHANEARLGSADLTAAPTIVDSITAQGSYDVLTGVLQLYRGELVAGDVGAAASAVVSPLGETPRIQIAGSISPMNAQQLKNIWPGFIAAKARTWVIDNVIDGQVTGATLLVDLDKDNLEKLKEHGPLESGALQLNFGFRDVKASFMDGMPPLQIVSGNGQLAGPQFKLDAQEGHVDLPSGARVELTSGTFDVPRLDHKISDGFFNLGLSGDVKALLEMLNHEPLGLLNKWALKPDAFGGKGSVALRLGMPIVEGLALEQVEVEAEAELSDVTGHQLLAGYDFSDGRILVNVKNQTVSIAGEGKVGEISTNLAWAIPFDGTGGADERPKVTMRLDDTSRTALGLSVQGLSGHVNLSIEPSLRSAGDQSTTASFSADLSDAALDLPALGLFKAAGEAATLSGAFSSQGDAIEIQQLEFASESIAALGKLKIDRNGELQSLSLPMLRLSANDNLTLNAERSAKGKLNVKLGGTYFDAAIPLARALQQGASAGDSTVATGDFGPIEVTVTLNRVMGRHGTEIRDLTALASIEAGKIVSLDLDGDTGGGAGLKATIRSDENDRRRLTLNAGNAGAALRFAGLYKRIEGGALSLDMELAADEQGNGRGLLKAEDFFIRGEPVIRSFSDSTPAINTPVAKVDSSRIRFDVLRMPFVTAPGRMILSETVLRGPSVGGSVEGQINFAANSLDLVGTYIPAYAVNNLLSHVPLFGRVLTGGENGGLVGVTFAVRGPVEAPVVTINPMSAVTPGVFRKIFDFSPSNGRTTKPASQRKLPPSAPVVTQ